MDKILIVISNRLIRLTGNLFKVLAYPVHWLMPKKRFVIPEYSQAKVVASKPSRIPRTIWQTNYSNKVTFPVYMNYLFNRLMSLEYDYRYVGDDEAAAYIKEHTSEQAYQAYLKLNDGAAKADFWRLVTLNTDGGIYLDMDASLVRPLKKLIETEDDALYVSLKKNNHVTNFFLASAPNNADYAIAIDKMVDNIENKRVEEGVYFLTGPGVLTEILEGKEYKSVERKFVCIQGAFTNEHFQYLDKPNSKWTHKKPKELLK
ncbi:glycosyltransferase family 32 protein [Vibrio sp. HN007]|uniref:glycosyltransferase family 32 protein n=1 Tax=Vibrio iocasae TaxID=3098914 RepID=UPI0035D4DD70